MLFRDLLQNIMFICLVYYEVHQNIMEAARRERRLKNWCRKWKLNIIEQCNPTWRDLYEEIST